MFWRKSISTEGIDSKGYKTEVHLEFSMKSEWKSVARVELAREGTVSGKVGVVRDATLFSDL